MRSVNWRFWPGVSVTLIMLAIGGIVNTEKFESVIFCPSSRTSGFGSAAPKSGAG
jgi:hypothetical protein